MNRLSFYALTLCLGFLATEQLSACSATSTYNCYPGGQLTCYGATCAAGATWVECDGVRTDCPACEVLHDCSWICPAGQSANIYCSSDVGRCSESVKWIQCDLTRIYCSSAICF
jgi:hypothetical protein